MDTIVALAPLALIVTVAAVLVWRGMRTPPDDTANRSVRKSDTHYWGGD